MVPIDGQATCKDIPGDVIARRDKKLAPVSDGGAVDLVEAQLDGVGGQLTARLQLSASSAEVKTGRARWYVVIDRRVQLEATLESGRTAFRVVDIGSGESRPASGRVAGKQVTITVSNADVRVSVPFAWHAATERDGIRSGPLEDACPGFGDLQRTTQQFG